VSAGDATRLVLRCLLQGVLVVLVMSLLDPVTRTVVEKLAGH
jgi:hypothetical protein